MRRAGRFTDQNQAGRWLIGFWLALGFCLWPCMASAAAPEEMLLAATESSVVTERLVLESGDALIGRSRGIERGYLQWELRNEQLIWVPLEWVDRMDPAYVPEKDPSPVQPAIHVEPAPAPVEKTAPPDIGELDTSVTVPLPPGPDVDAPESPWFVAFPLYPQVQQGYAAAIDSYGAVSELASTWTRRFTFGGQFNDGNSQTDMFNLQLDFEHSPPNQLRQFELTGQIGRNQGVMSTNRWNFNSNFDWPLQTGDEKWIAFATSKNEYDGLANLDYRGTFSSGAGYRFFNEAKRRFITRFGPGYTIEVFEDPNSNRETLDLFGEVEVRWPVRKWASLEHKLRVNPSVLNFELVRVVSTSSLLLDLDEKNRWKLRLGFNYTYISEPSPGRVPADYVSTLSLMYTRR